MRCLETPMKHESVPGSNVAGVGAGRNQRNLLMHRLRVQPTQPGRLLRAHARLRCSKNHVSALRTDRDRFLSDAALAFGSGNNSHLPGQFVGLSLALTLT